MIPTAEHWGPFAPGLTPTERAARCRQLAGLVRVFAGPRGDDVVVVLGAAETDDECLEMALDRLNRLPARTRRHVLAAYAALNRPPAKDDFL